MKAWQNHPNNYDDNLANRLDVNSAMYKSFLVDSFPRIFRHVIFIES
jgi:hypothetical protein